VAVVAWAAVVAVDVVVAGRLRATATRTTTTTLALRVPVPYTLAVSAPGARSARLRQPVPAELALQPSEGAGPELGGQLTGLHRGVHRLPPAVIRATGPIGLGSCDHPVGGDDTVTVFPDLPKARRLTAARRRGRSTDEGRIRSRLGIGTELESIRDYSPDDDVRQVNWLATARLGRPMSNQYRVEQDRDVLCLVDAGRLTAAPVGRGTLLDASLDATAAIGLVADELGDRCGAIAFHAEVTRTLPPQRLGGRRVVQGLFDLQSELLDSDFERAFLRVGRARRGLMFVFTDLIDEAAARSLLAATPMLARRHAVIVASVSDPALQASAATAPQRPEGVYELVAAVSVLQARADAVRRIRRAGTEVVQAPAGQLPERCVQAYLRAKARARL